MTQRIRYLAPLRPWATLIMLSGGAGGSVVSFGPEIKPAKMLVDNCLRCWSESVNANLKVMVMDAFDVAKDYAWLQRRGMGNARWELISFDLFRLDVSAALCLPTT
ncbi:DUF3164 family protein, partial [Acetobacter okinawensis]